MKNKYELEREIEESLNQEKLYVDYVTIDDSRKTYPLPVLIIKISGDWKHEHLRLDYSLAEQGYVTLGKEITEESDGDWYTAKHIYYKEGLICG